MYKALKLLVCLLVVATSSLAVLNPNSAFAKQKEERVAKKEQVVYATKRGKKYHKEECPFIKNRDTTSMSIEEAVSKGLKPCGRCSKKEAE